MFENFTVDTGDVLNAVAVIVAVFLGNYLMKLYDQRKDSAKKNKEQGVEEAESKAWRNGVEERVTTIEDKVTQIENVCPARHTEIKAQLNDLKNTDVKYDQAVRHLEAAYGELRTLTETSKQHLNEILKVQTLYKEQLEHTGQVSELKMNRLEENINDIKDSMDKIVIHLNNMNGKVNRHENDLTKIKTKMNI